MNKVLHHLHRAVECDPRFADAYVSLAREYKKEEDPSHYTKFIIKAISIDKKLIRELEKQQVDYAGQNLFGLVRKVFFLELEQKRHLSNLLIELGYFHFENGEIKKALRIFEDAEMVDPLNADVYYYFGLVYLKRQKYKNAHKSFIHCVERDIHHAGANLELGKHFQRTKDYHLAEVHFFCALETYPYEPVIHILICKLCIKTNDLDSAKHHYESALSMDASSKNRKLENILNI